ncbi:MAG: hypothetical protein LBS62_10885 [Clostridiales bacterium]|jgi:hypothetical protein|nr:hypothetical protein [Clostridiales bacterium]
MKAAEPTFSVDYVYTPENNDECFKKIHVELYIKDNKPEFLIKSEEDLSTADLEQIVAYFQHEKFDRLKINLYEECRIILCVKGQREAVHFEDGAPRVLEFALLDR